MTATTRSCAVALFVLIAAFAVADDWPGPQVQTAFSEDGSRFVRVIPGESFGDTVGFAGGPKGAYATAHLYELLDDRSYRLTAEFRLLNPVAPVDLLLSDGGYLVTFDNWHNAGYGEVLAVYGPDGRVIASWELEQLYPLDRLRRIRTSISSRWWRCPAAGFVDRGEQTKVYISEALGGSFVVDLESGELTHNEGTSECGRAVEPAKVVAAARPDRAVPRVDPEVAFVSAGGPWSDEERSGTVRVVVVDHGYEHVTSRVTIEWILVDRKAGASVAESLPVAEINEAGVWSVGMPEIGFENGHTVVRLPATSSYDGETADFEIHVSAPGELDVRRLEGRRRDP